MKIFLGFLPLYFSPVLIIFLILAAIGGYVWLNRQKLFSAAAPFAQNGIRQLTTTGKVGLAAISPDGKLFAYTIDDTGQKSLWLGFVNGGNHLPLRPAAAAVFHALAFSPDSNYLYFSILDEQNPKSALYKMPESGGVPIKILDEIGHFALSPDGKHFAFTRGELLRDVVLMTNH